MKLLAFDTSTQACSAAIWIDGEVREKYEIAPRRHAELVLPMLDELLSESQLSVSDIDCVAFGKGPGAFTGLRIATGIAQGIGMAADCPLVPVSSLRALAQGCWHVYKKNNVLCAFDARMQEVYWGVYQEKDGIMLPLIDDSVCKPAHIPVPEGDDWYGVGDGWASYGDILTQRLSGKVSIIDENAYPHAECVAELGANDYAAGYSVAADEALPAYLRDDVATKSP